MASEIERREAGAGRPLELYFLGSGNAFVEHRYWSSFLLNGRYLFDAPPTTLPHLKRNGTNPNDIDAIFISHFHADHWFGLPFLLLEYNELSQRKTDLHIIGPPGVEERVERLTMLGFPHLAAKEALGKYRRRYIDAADGLKGAVGDLEFEAVRVEHAASLECFGYKVRVGGRTLSYSGDALMGEPVRALAEGADVFVLECTNWSGYCGPHMSTNDIRLLREEAPSTTTFILTHLNAEATDLGLDGVLLAKDFETLKL